MADDKFSWTVGTATLVGVVVGAFLGFIFNQPPLLVAVGLTIGAALDSWQHNRAEL